MLNLKMTQRQHRLFWFQKHHRKPNQVPTKMLLYIAKPATTTADIEAITTAPVGSKITLLANCNAIIDRAALLIGGNNNNCPFLANTRLVPYVMFSCISRANLLRASSDQHGSRATVHPDCWQLVAVACRSFLRIGNAWYPPVRVREYCDLLFFHNRAHTRHGSTILAFHRSVLRHTVARSICHFIIENFQQYASSNRHYGRPVSNGGLCRRVDWMEKNQQKWIMNYVPSMHTDMCVYYLRVYYSYGWKYYTHGALKSWVIHSVYDGNQFTLCEMWRVLYNCQLYFIDWVSGMVVLVQDHDSLTSFQHNPQNWQKFHVEWRSMTDFMKHVDYNPIPNCGKGNATEWSTD